MKIRSFQVIYPDFERIESLDDFCEDIKNEYQSFQKNDLFKKSPQNAIYIYQINASHHKHTGLVALNDVQDFFDEKIKKHEKTLRDKEDQQIKLFLQWDAILKPVLLTYETVPEINRWMEAFTRKHKPFAQEKFEKDGQIHKMWAVTEAQDIAHLQQLFEQHVNCTYIADGHHRTTAVAILNQEMKEKKPDLDFDNLFCAYFSADQLDILDYNRVVKGQKTTDPVELMARFSKIFDIKVLPKAEKPTKKHELVVFIQKKWYRLNWKPEILNKMGDDTLDANLLNELVFRDIFEIEDVRSDTRIAYITGSKGLNGLRKTTNETKKSVGFALYPVSFGDMMRLSDAGESLPPKSTYFEPRLKSGMLVKSLKKSVL